MWAVPFLAGGAFSKGQTRVGCLSLSPCLGKVTGQGSWLTANRTSKFATAVYKANRQEKTAGERQQNLKLDDQYKVT